MNLTLSRTQVGMLLVLLACLSCGRQPARPAKSPESSSVSPAVANHALPPAAKSPHLNTTSAATYVGSQACVECHPDEFDTYRRTPHSLALADIDLDTEPPDAEFEHASSRRVYRNYRRDDQLWHRESIRAQNGQQVVLGDYPVRYVIGSGNHSRSYLIEIDGFLVESPLTWYTSRKEWSLSPGYDKTRFGFSRPASFQCLNCHAGRVGSVEGSVHRLDLLEYAIGCERCHGPGSLHVKRWNSNDDQVGDADLTIVHPGRLQRELQEAICDQCHLRSATTVAVRGRSVSDFRPGLPGEYFQVHYGLKVPNQEMKVAGHAEQMRLSRCYQGSETLTCTTCHNPHDKPAHEIGRAYYRQRCLSCHASDPCGVSEEDRIAQAQNDCSTCHMPQVPIDVPHFAFTHHRIGIHSATAEKVDPDDHTVEAMIGNLEAMHDLSHLSRADRERIEGLGYLDMASAAMLKGQVQVFQNYRQRAERILQGVYQQGLRDAEVEVALAGLFSDRDQQQAIRYAEAALAKDEELSPDARANAHLILGGAFFRLQQNSSAIQSLEKLVRLRRNAEDWMMLGICQFRAGQIPQAIAALQQAAAISPDRPDVHQYLAEMFRLSGNSTLAQQHRQLAEFFTQAAQPR